MDARVAPWRLSPLADTRGADLGPRQLSEDRLQRHLLLRSAEGPHRSDVARRGRPRNSQGLREARHSAEGTGNPRRRAEVEDRRRCRVRQRLGRHHLQGRAEEGRRDLHVDLRGDPRTSRAGAEVSRLRRSDDRQLLCDAELRGLHRRFLRLRAEGRSLPDGTFHLFPHQREEHRPVRAYADHRRGGRLRVLSRRLHGAAARREPASRCRRRARRPR
ncbi:hypothetical protein D9M68_487480 [compost metagenome]